MPNRIKGKTALITGATAGIGRATAEILADSEVNLILTGRRSERLIEDAQKIHKQRPVLQETLATATQPRCEA